MDNLRVAVYTRVSTNKNEQQLSFINQQSYYAQYCDEQGYELIKIYADEGLSGTNNKRKKFLEMMIDAGLSYSFGSSNKIINFDRSSNPPLFDLIIVKDVSRFARNTDVTRAAELLAEKGVYIFFENNNLITSKEGWQFELDLYLSFAKREALDRSKKVKWARKYKASQNKFHFSRIPFGYKYDKKSGQYIISSYEAEIVKEMFNMYCNENKGCRLIAKWLTENAVINRTAKNRAARWNESTVSRMLENQVYIGNVVVGKIENNISGTGIRKKIDKKDWKIIENAIEPIISPEMYQAAQKIRSERRRKLTNDTVKGAKISSDIFSGKIKCGLCGSDFVRVSGTKKNREGIRRTEVTYYCKNRRRYGTCTMRGISFNVLSREILKAANSVKKYYDEQSQPQKAEISRAEMLLEILDAKIIRAEEEKQSLELKISELRNEQTKIARAFIQANEAMTDVLNDEINLITKKINLLINHKSSFDLIEIEREKKLINKKLENITALRNMEFFNLDQAVNFLNYVTVNENKELVFNFKSETLLFVSMRVMQLSDRVAERWSINDSDLETEIGFIVKVNY